MLAHFVAALGAILRSKVDRVPKQEVYCMYPAHLGNNSQTEEGHSLLEQVAIDSPKASNVDGIAIVRNSHAETSQQQGINET